MKQRNKYKSWQYTNIKRLRRKKPKLKKLDKCYRCGYAGLKFDTKRLCFIPYCFYKTHPGEIKHINIKIWNANLDFREKKYEEYRRSKNKRKDNRSKVYNRSNGYINKMQKI